MRGCAIEFRINAEDPLKDFRPSPGRIDQFDWPTGPGVRVDSHLFLGYQIPPFYDSLLAKIIVHDENRIAAIERGLRALGELNIGGVKTTTPLHLALLRDPSVRAGDFHTNFLEGWVSNWNKESAELVEDTARVPNTQPAEVTK